MLGSSGMELFVLDKPIAEARNTIVEYGLEKNVDYIFFLGDDVIPPGDAIIKLHSHRDPLVTGVYWTKGYPTHPYIWRGGGFKGPYTDWKLGEYFSVEYAGVDCLLASTEVFKNVKPPWFSTKWNFYEGQPPPGHITEDFYFYKKAKTAGFELMCDSTVQCLHEDRESGELFGLTSDMNLPLKDTKRMIADLRMNGQTDFKLRGTIHRYDSREDVKPYRRTDLRTIPSANSRYHYVYVENALEYFAKEEAPKLVTEWTRILRKRGKLTLRVPNYRSNIDSYELFSYLSGWDASELETILERELQLGDCSVEEEDGVFICKGTKMNNKQWEVLEDL